MALGQTASALTAARETITRRAVAKKRKAKARRAASAPEPPKAPRTEAQLAAARANIERAREARQAQQAAQPHPADSPDKPAAFFAFGKGSRDKADAGDAPKGPKSAATRAADAVKRVLSAAEADTFQGTLEEVLSKLWKLLDEGLTAVIYEPEECFIWRTIDDDDNAFLARRVLREARQNPVIAGQVRLLVDHWDDLRVYTIVGPRLAESMRWIPAHGLDLSHWGGPAVPPTPSRRARSSAHTSGRGQSGPSPAPTGHATAGDYSANGHMTTQEAYVYGD